MLSPQEIIDDYYYGEEKVTPDILNIGLKKKFKTDSDGERIKECQDNLKRLLSVSRTARSAERSTAKLLEDGRIHITKKCGKWHWTNDYLKPHEALYLMQSNKLEIYHDSVILSLEKAYGLLLATDTQRPTTSTSEHFLVYSKLISFGCTIKDSNSDANEEDRLESSSYQPIEREPSTAAVCTWRYLRELLRSKISAAPLANSEEYAQIKNSMDGIMEGIAQQTTSFMEAREEEPIPSEEMSLAVYQPKKLNITLNRGYVRSRRRLNDFMAGKEFNLFQDVFDHIDVISPLAAVEITKNSRTRDILRTLFNVGIIDNDTKKAKYQYKVIVLRKQDRVPAIQQAFQTSSNSNYGPNAVFVYVSQEFSFYSFIYRFV